MAPSISSGRDQFMKTLNWDGPAGDPRERGHYSRWGVGVGARVRVSVFALVKGLACCKRGHLRRFVNRLSHGDK